VALTCAFSLAWLRLRHGRPRDEAAQFRYGQILVGGFQRLGGVYIKFGQLLAMRPDLLPRGLTRALESLLDSVPPEALAASRQTLCEELGADSLDAAFVRFDPVPIGAASFGVVYRAVLASGAEVAVKVQRRGIDRLVVADLALLRIFATVMDLTGRMRRFNVSDFVADFAAWTRDELDYRREARVMTWLRQQHADTPGIFIPRVEWSLTTARVLVSTYLEGVWVTAIGPDTRQRLPLAVRQEAARQLAHALLRQIFEFGIFHADPHPGNLCVLADGRVGLIDFGIVGTLSSDLQLNQLGLLAAVQRQDLDAAFEAILRVLHVPPDARLREFRRRFDRNINDWLLAQLEPFQADERSASVLLLNNFEAARDCGLSFEPLAVRYYRTFLVLDHVARELDPDFNVIDLMHAYLLDRFRRARSKASRDSLADGGAQLQMQAFELLRRLPDLSRIIDRYARPGELITASFSPMLRTVSGILGTVGRVIRYVVVGELLLLGYLLLAGVPVWLTTLLPSGLGAATALIWLGVAGVVVQAMCFWLSRLAWAQAFRQLGGR